jgi:hypothetical protein
MPDALSELPGFQPDWALPSGVTAWQTCRGNGPKPYGGFNLGQHVGDDPDHVDDNRARLQQRIPNKPVWLDQVHGTTVVEIPLASDLPPPQADAVMTCAPNVVCAIMTADCLPVLLADRSGRIVGAAHAGWRGLASGVLEALVGQMTQRIAGRPQDLTAWLGPAIGPTAFEVGSDVVDAFVSLSTDNQHFFSSQAPGKWLANLSGLATQKLRALGVTDVTPSGCCTYEDPNRFYSYRRDQVTGRMASMIWMRA